MQLDPDHCYEAVKARDTRLDGVFFVGVSTLLRALQIKRPAQLKAAAEPWRPWRAYAAMHLWHSLAAGG